jgi:predicted dehydrogenase/nucleoside-diphosphate-sugar epimerase
LGSAGFAVVARFRVAGVIVSATEAPARVALVGAGFIADVHAEVLTKRSSTSLAVIVDPSIERADALAARWNVPARRADPQALGTELAVDAAHVLVPPPLHRRVAEPLLARGIDVFLEKPMAETAADCAALEDAARQGGARLGVNLNFVHHPAFARLRTRAAAGAVGPPRHVALDYLVPLRQLAAGQLGHWMFDSPRNLLLEQAVHPLSQLDALLGPLTVTDVVPEAPREVLAGVDLATDWRIEGHGPSTTFSLRLAFGCPRAVWRVRAIGTDGSLDADMVQAVTVGEWPTPWLEAIDRCAVELGAGWQRARQGVGGLAAYGAAQLGVRARADGFFASMRASIDAFHDRTAGDTAAASRPRRLVELCERIGAATPAGRPRPQVTMVRPDEARADVLLLGGTGFLGRHLVAALVAEGCRVAVMARRPGGLPTTFADANVQVVKGDANDRAAVAPAVRAAGTVVHLAPGAGTSWAEIERRMVGGARLVAECCRESGRPLIFTSSIAALYLGDPEVTATAATAPDPVPEQRADYARGKVESERVLRALAAEADLPLAIVRPGVVVGAGTSPFHSGIGLFNCETHCLGWNAGRNPLPLVLAADVAAAMARLCTGGVNGLATANLVGDVRVDARRYIAALAEATGRPLRYHPQSPRWTAVVEAGKWGIKRVAGRRTPRTTLRDLRSRGLVTPFDTTAEKAALDWRPESDPQRFFERAFAGATA